MKTNTTRLIDGAKMLRWTLVVMALVAASGCASLRDRISGKSWSERADQEGQMRRASAADSGDSDLAPW